MDNNLEFASMNVDVLLDEKKAPISGNKGETF